ARGSAARQLEELYGPRAPLAASLLLAQRDGVDPAVRDRFARSGLSHLLAISGLHVGLVAGLLLLLGRLLRLPASRAAIVAGTGTAAYVLFLGAPASASRAALQVILLLAAVGAQRPARSEAVVATAALVLLALRPAALLEPGFQLSFAGVAGILALRRPLLRRLRFLTSRRALGVDAGKWLADGLATGVAATVSTGPVVAWHFGQVAPIGVVANLVAIPLVAALVPVLALSLAVGSLWTGAGAFLAGSGALLLGCLEHVASAAAGLPGAGLAVSPGTTMALTAAGGLAFLSTRRLGQVRPRLRALVGVGVGGAALLLAPVRPTTDHLEIHMIDVGQGDAIAIRTPGNRWILVDAGIAGDRFDAGERRVVPYLSLRGVRRLDGVVLTHPHLDHFGGAAAVVDAFRPQWIGGPGRLAASPEYLELVERAAARGTAWVRLHHGAELVADGVVVEFLHPLADHPTMDEDPNSSSVVMRLSYGEFSALLTGDAPAEVEDALVRRLGHLLEAEVLKVGHHGSRTSTTPALLEATGARAALISAGKGNRYGHPHRSVLSRLDSAGLRVFRTDTDGNVVVLGRSNGEWSVRSDRGSP
ncbi:MAG TPA: DNA internalization-related competence protein ComEC/Rec2, partial [Longimicrobiales bacterium]|nr:DNA internalization-related competence protein ComEC/Rec2 [Longimicrobiales bacterium]